MSVIQKIRDKYSRVAVIAIAVALLGFILIDYISGRSRALFSSGNSTTVGSVNGNKIEINDFDRLVKQQEDYMKQQGYPQEGEASREQAINAAWDQEISRVLMNDEIEKMGIRVGKKEINDMLFGENAPADLKRQFTDPKTGQYDGAAAQQAITQMKNNKSKDPRVIEQKENFNNYIDQLEFGRMADKYSSLLSNSINFPRWFLEKQNADNSELGKISMVRDVYSSIPDSSIKISDQEIADYISKHKDDYKQEESRAIEYVSFSASPSTADSMDAKNKAQLLKAEFDSTKDITDMLAREGANPGYDGYISGKVIQIANKDSIFKTPVGHVYGPYLDRENYTLAKVLGAKEMPDTVKIRHILIATAQQDRQTGQMTPTKDTVVAKKLIDSIQTAIRNGSNFDSLCAKFSDDGTKDKGGVYDKVTSGQMVPTFNDFIFTNPVGTKGVVKTEFGYHYIEILSQKGSSMGYKIAYLPKQIVASTETDNNASNQANLFAGDSRDQKSFDANFEKNLKPKKINKNIAPDIKPAAFEIPGIGVSRSFVKEIYKAKRGEVLQPERIDDNYVVAVVTEVNEEGTQGVAKARITVEPILRNKKKAGQIIQKIGKITTLEAAATILGKQIEPMDSLRMSSSKIGYEPRVVGAAFNPANKGKVVPEALEGTSGVFVIRVDSVTATSLGNANVAEQRKQMYQQTKQTGSPLAALKNAATIKDRRAERY